MLVPVIDRSNPSSKTTSSAAEKRKVEDMRKSYVEQATETWAGCAYVMVKNGMKVSCNPVLFLDNDISLLMYGIMGLGIGLGKLLVSLWSRLMEKIKSTSRTSSCWTNLYHNRPSSRSSTPPPNRTYLSFSSLILKPFVLIYIWTQGDARWPSQSVVRDDWESSSNFTTVWAYPAPPECWTSTWDIRGPQFTSDRWWF